MCFSPRYDSASGVQSRGAASRLLVPAWLALALKGTGAGKVLWLKICYFTKPFSFLLSLGQILQWHNWLVRIQPIRLRISLARESARVEEDSRKCPGQLKTDVGRVPDQQREAEFTQSI